MDKDRKDLQKTNIGKLHDAYIDGARIYKKGVGSDWYTKYSLGGLSGAGGKKRVEEAYADLVREYNRAKPEDQVIDIFGFSRGAAQARDLVNFINERGIPNTNGEIIGYRDVIDHEKSTDDEVVYKKEAIYENFKDVSVRFLGLFDTVASTGIPGNDLDLGYNLAIPQDGFVKNVYHATANHEYRGLFDSQSIKRSKDEILPSNFVEQGFIGAHSDIGNGYLPGEDGKFNTLGNITLNWMYNSARQKNIDVKFKPLNADDQQLPNIKGLSEKELHKNYIHDSRYFWERWFGRKHRDTFYPKPPAKVLIRPQITIESREGR